MGYPMYIVAVIHYVEAHITEGKIDYKRLEREIGFSQAHIRTLFRQIMGCPLVRYVRMRKVKRSAMELLHTNEPILHIAYHYGFSNPETYTRAFQSITGMTPSAFRRKRPIVGKEKLINGIYSIGILERKEQRSDMVMEKKVYKNNDSTILYGVSKVAYGCYGGMTPFPMCLKVCLEYLGEDLEYADAMVLSAAAFRFAWNRNKWDLSNVDIYHTFEESNEIYRLGAWALGREFSFLGRRENTTKEEFVSFIKKHIGEGYPSLALEIVGSPEECIITGYRRNGEELLGWNFFQDNSEFAASVEIDECGYFVSNKWWENTDTQAVMCIGSVIGEAYSTERIAANAVKALTAREDGAYSKGVKAYDAWKNALQDEKSFRAGDNYSVLFEKLLCQMDAITCLSDGRSGASSYFEKMARKDKLNGDCYKEIAEAFARTANVIARMRELYGGWENSDVMLKNLADVKVREKTCTLIEEAQKSDSEALELLRGLLK